MPRNARATPETPSFRRRPHERVRETRSVLPGQVVRHEFGSTAVGPHPVRLEGPHHPRRHHRHDRQRQDRAGLGPARGGADRQHPGHRDRPQGRPAQPAAHISQPRRRRLPALGRRSGSRPRGHGRTAVRGAPGRAVAQGPGRVGSGTGAHRAPARGGRVRGLHARQPRRAPRERARQLRAARPRGPGGSRSPARTRAGHGHLAAVARRRGGRCRRPRARPGRQHSLHRLVRRQGPRLPAA